MGDSDPAASGGLWGGHRGLSEHANNKPLFGFVKRHLGDDVRFQRDLDMALGDHTARGNEKGVMLCLWAGADPHALVPPLRYLSYGWYDEEDEEESDLHSAVYEPCHAGRPDLLRRMRPDPSRDDFHDPYRAAGSSEIVAELARLSSETARPAQTLPSWSCRGAGRTAQSTLGDPAPPGS